MNLGFTVQYPFTLPRNRDTLFGECFLHPVNGQRHGNDIGHGGGVLWRQPLMHLQIMKAGRDKQQVILS